MKGLVHVEAPDPFGNVDSLRLIPTEAERQRMAVARRIVEERERRLRQVIREQIDILHPGATNEGENDGTPV